MTSRIDVEGIRNAVRNKYAAVARSGDDGTQYPAGKPRAIAFGYDPAVLREIPEDALTAFCGVGNPFSLGPIHPGEVLLDVGCGTGVDLIVGSRLVGPTGRAHGIDLTPEMVEIARKNLAYMGISNARVSLAGSEAIPYDDQTFDVAISNGVLNLSPLKQQAFQEIHRVLKPGGRLQFADIVLNEDLPTELANSLEAWCE
jgi:SAM-dependent methyltransferase